MKTNKPTKEELKAVRQEAKKDRQIFFDLIRRLKAKGVLFEIITG